MRKSDMVSSLWSKKFYTAPIDYITSSFIREYDISKADISIFLSKGVITQEQYNFLYRIPGLARNIQMGILQQEQPELKKVYSSGIEDIRRQFFEVNDIQDQDVLSIKNDAIFLINKIPSVTSFNGVTLKNKNTYTSFYKLPRRFNKEFYYYLDRINNIEILDIKGMGEKEQQLHVNHMTEFLLVLFNSIELFPLDDAIQLLQTFYNRYINRELDIGYYRRYDQISGYDIIMNTPILKDRYNLKHLSPEHREMIDISYNVQMIIELYKMVSNMYFANPNKKK